MTACIATCPSRLVRRGALILCLLWAAIGGAARAEWADRNQPLVVESDGRQAATVDLARKITTLVGNVVITQGTLQLRAERVEVRETAPGRYAAQAKGSPGHPATYRQKRDRQDEVVEAEAQTIDYDGGADRVRFVGGARLRVLRGGVPADEASAAVIVYDQRAQTVDFEGAPDAASKPAGRARLVFVPRPSEPPASAPPAESPR